MRLTKTMKKDETRAESDLRASHNGLVELTVVAVVAKHQRWSVSYC